MAERSSRIESTTMTAVVALMALFPLLGRRDPALTRVRDAPMETGSVEGTDDRISFAAPSWADPFEAVAVKQGDAIGRPTILQSQHPWGEFRSVGPARFYTLVVTTPDGLTAVSTENRRRTRYALATAMTQMRWAPSEGGALRLARSGETGSDWVYELYEPIDAERAKTERAAVIWLGRGRRSERSLLDAAQEAFRNVTRSLKGENPPECEDLPRLIGPEDSDALLDAYLLLAPQGSDGTRQPQTPIAVEDWQVISPWATLSRYALDKEFGEGPGRCSQWATQLISPDDDSVRALVKELSGRGFDPASLGHRVAVISDSNTAYGRRMREVVLHEISKRWRTLTGIQLASCVESYGYLSGIDGIWRPQAQPAASSKPGDSKLDRGQAYSALVEPGRGPSQKDYLRRLVGGMADRDFDDLQRRDLLSGLLDPTSHRVYAVFVMAADPYDKLLIMEAVRAQMPNVLVCTLDLDSDMLHPQAIPFTRNALVASTYPLEPTLKRGLYTPPFRDQYQTAVFQAVQRAMNPGYQEPGLRAPSPRVCEITKEGTRWFEGDNAVQRPAEVGRALMLTILGVLATTAVGYVGICGALAFRGLSGIPQRSAEAAAPPPPRRDWRASIALIWRSLRGKSGVAAGRAPAAPRAIGATVRAFRWWRDPVGTGWGAVCSWFKKLGGHVEGDDPLAAQRTPIAAAVVMAAVVVVGQAPLILLARWLLQTGTSGLEPMAWADGSSAWPSEALKGFIFVACFAYMLWMWKELSRSASEAIKGFGLRIARPKPDQAETWWRYAGCWRDLRGLIRRLARMLVAKPSLSLTDSEIVASEEGWRFLIVGRLGFRLLRSFVMTLVYCLAFIGAWVLLSLDYLPASMRDPSLRKIDFWFGFLVWFSATWMLFFLIDATLLTATGIARLSKGPTSYDDDVLRKASGALGVSPPLSAGPLDIALIARAGQAVADLAYVPVLLLMLLMAAQSRAFDNWSWNLPVLVSFGLSFGLIVLSGWVLRQSSEFARNLELHRIDQAAPDLIAQGKVAIKDVERAKEFIRSVDTGPYASFSEQPFFRIVFLPLSGAGIYGLIDLASRMMV